MTKGRKAYAAVLMTLLMLFAAVFAIVSRAEPASAVSEAIVENEYFDILKPQGMENKKQFAASEDKEYLAGNPLLFRLVAKNGRVFSSVFYTDGDAGEKLEAVEDGGVFLIKLRYNEVYTFYLDENGTETAVEVNLSNRNIFDITAPVVDFSKTTFSSVVGSADMHVYINDDVSSRRHITAKSGIKRVKVVATNRTDPIFEKSDYREGTGTGNDGFYIVLQSVNSAMGDITAEVEDHAGHISHISVAVWSNIYRTNARDMMSRADAVLKKEVGGVGLSEKLKERLTSAVARLNELLNDDGSSDLQIREATTSLGNVKEEAENAFKTESGRAYSSVDETLILRVLGEEYLYGGNVYLSNQKTTDYFGAAAFGDEVIVVLTIKQSVAERYEAREGLEVPKNFDAYIEYDVRLTVNGEEKTAETPFYVTIPKTEEYTSPVLFAPSGSGYETAEFQSDVGWIRFEVAQNGVYTVFLKKQDGIKWWAWLLIALGAAAVLGAVSAATVCAVKKVRAKKLT